MNIKRLGKAIFSGSMVIAAGLLAASLYISMAYADTILPGIKIAGRDVSGMSRDEAVSNIDQSLLGEIELKVADDSIVVDPLTVGITWPVEQTVKDTFLIGHSQNVWDNLGQILKTLFITRSQTLDASVDEVVLNQFVQENIASYIKEPVDATLSIVNNQVVVNHEEDGMGIYLVKLKEDIKQAVLMNQDKAVIEVKTEVIEPNVKAKELANYKAKIEELAAVPIAVDINGASYSIALADKINWYQLVKTDNAFDIQLNKQAVTATVAAVAKKYDVKAVNEQVSENGVLLAQGQDGLKINQTNLVDGITNAANQVVAGKNQVAPVVAVLDVTPKETITVASTDQSVVPAIQTDAKFIQVSLAKQKMYLFEGGQLVNVFAISSGKAGMDTPRGVHQIFNKALRPYSATYGLYMPYWQAITADGKYGIHELPEWPNGYKEGANHLGVPVSHGCMRLGEGPAGYVYDWAPVGTAVIVQ